MYMHAHIHIHVHIHASIDRARERHMCVHVYTRAGVCRTLRESQKLLALIGFIYIYMGVPGNRVLFAVPRPPPLPLQTFVAGPLLQTLVEGLGVEYCSLQ